jgi:hypothetical protein
MKRLALIVLLLLAVNAAADEKRFLIPIGDSPSTGPPDAAITIIEFLDFQ